MKQSNWIQILAVLLLAGSLYGCASRNGGYKITDETVAFIEPGVTTRSDVIDNMGPPLFELNDPHVIAYSWGRVRATTTHAVNQNNPEFQQPGPMDYGSGSLGSTAPGWDQGDTVQSRRWICCVELDNKDKVTKYGKFEVQPSTTLEQAVRRWAVQGTP